MAEQVQEFSGKNVEDAIDEGLRQTGLSRRDVEIEVISKGSRGIFGLGSEPARVRIQPKRSQSPQASPEPVAPIEEEVSGDAPGDQGSGQSTAAEAPPPTTAPTSTTESTAVSSQPSSVQAAPHTEPAPEKSDTGSEIVTEEETDASEIGPTDDGEELRGLAVELLDGLLSRMGFPQAQIVTSWEEDEEDGARYLLLDVQGDDLGVLIGRRGETLASIQYLVRLMINQRLRQWKNVVIDVEQYKHRRVTQLTQLANRMAEQVVDSGRAVSLEPMPANERRIVHLALRDHPEVYTQSSGEGDRRKVHIVARE